MATPFNDARPRRVSARHPELIEVVRVSMPVMLVTEEAQRILTRRFESYQHSAYFLFFVAREYLPAKRLEPVEQSLWARLDVTTDVINKEIDKANAWAKAHQTYPRLKEHLPPLSIDIGVCTSLSRRYLAVITQLDDVLWRFHAIGRIDLKHRDKWKARANDLTRYVRDVDVDARREIETLKRNSPGPANHGLD